MLTLQMIQLAVVVGAFVTIAFGSFTSWTAGFDWSQFLPDVIVALITGIVVGLALVVVQRNAESRDQTKRARDEWDDARIRLLAIGGGAPVLNPLDATDLGPTVQRIYDYATQLPLRRWSDRTSDDRIDALVEFVQLTDFFKSQAAEYELLLHAAVRGAGLTDKDAVFAMLCARCDLHGLDIEETIRSVGIENPTGSAAIGRELVDQLYSGNRRLVISHANYHSTWHMFTAALENFRSRLYAERS